RKMPTPITLALPWILAPAPTPPTAAASQSRKPVGYGSRAARRPSSNAARWNNTSDTSISISPPSSAGENPATSQRPRAARLAGHGPQGPHVAQRYSRGHPGTRLNCAERSAQPAREEAAGQRTPCRQTAEREAQGRRRHPHPGRDPGHHRPPAGTLAADAPNS